jgi:hypothetical protein
LKKNDNEQEIKGLDNNILQSVDKEIKNKNNTTENKNKEKKINQKKMKLYIIYISQDLKNYSIYQNNSSKFSL